jgi:hypothetical protein
MTQYDADMMAAMRDSVGKLFPHTTVRKHVHGIKSQITQRFPAPCCATAETLRARFG